MYDESLIHPMREELTRNGVAEARTADEVDAQLASGKQTVLFFINSVCGCAARSARPGLLRALSESSVRPDAVVTAFAGNDTGAVGRIRQLCEGYAPSSPCAALFRDGKHVYMLERHQIEGRNPAEVAAQLVSGFERYCGETIREDVEVVQANSEANYGKDRCFC